MATPAVGPASDPQCRPIIYVRGYAGSDSEIEDTVAEPYMGFALGATKFRQLSDGNVRRHYFESPLFRLVKDYGYKDVYSGGREMPIDLNVGMKSVFIYRFYDEQYFDDLCEPTSGSDAVAGKRRSIEDFAEGLSRLILRVRDRICGTDAGAKKAFRVFLVGHSMGGLVCRCFLQNRNVGSEEARGLVDKVFTYATPHNGIDFSLVGNVPSFFSMNDANNFNRERMGQYLGLRSTADVSNLNGQFDVNRFFCLVGTNWKDYEVAAGWSRRLAGPMSDGLVRIANASVFSQVGSGPKTNGPRAFVDRSHSGHYGIVNSEEGYQNLVRFLFGDVRVDGVLEVQQLTLPDDVEAKRAEGKKIMASYHFETIVRVRGADWELHRRTVDDQSAIFRTYDELFGDDAEPRHPYLFSVFLSARGKVVTGRASLGFAIDLGVLVPEYEVEGNWFRDNHYKGSYLFRDTITIEATPQTDAGKETYEVAYGFDSESPNKTPKNADLEKKDGAYEFRIPLASNTKPGLKGTLVLTAREWE